MEHSYIDEYSHIDSFIHRLEPRIKIIGLLSFILSVALTPRNSFVAFGFYCLLIVILIALSKIPLAFVMKRALSVIPFVLMLAISILFLKSGRQAGAAYDGLAAFCNILIKAVLSIMAMTALMTTTNFSALLKALEKLKFPSIFIMIISFMYRYIFILQDELMKMKQAKESRSVGGSRWFHLRALANMLGVLFIRSYERAEEVYLAMCCRGFDGRINTIYDFKIGLKDFSFLLAIVGLLGLIRIFGS